MKPKQTTRFTTPSSEEAAYRPNATEQLAYRPDIRALAHFHTKAYCKSWLPLARTLPLEKLFLGYKFSPQDTAEEYRPQSDENHRTSAVVEGLQESTWLVCGKADRYKEAKERYGPIIGGEKNDDHPVINNTYVCCACPSSPAFYNSRAMSRGLIHPRSLWLCKRSCIFRQKPFFFRCAVTLFPSRKRVYSR